MTTDTELRALAERHARAIRYVNGAKSGASILGDDRDRLDAAAKFLTELKAALSSLAKEKAELLAALEYLVAEVPDDLDDDFNPHTAPIARARAVIARHASRQSGG